MRITKFTFIGFILLFFVCLAGCIFAKSIFLGIGAIVFFVIIIIVTISICKHGFISSEEIYRDARENHRQLIRDTVDTTMKIIVEEFIKKEAEEKVVGKKIVKNKTAKDRLNAI